jgi:hypothetical protein
VARIFIIFLIALLPLRGWSFDRMALQMDGDAHAVGIAHDSDTGMSPDCAMLMQMDNKTQDADSEQVVLHQGCQSCQLCMPLAGLNVLAPLASTSLVQTVPELRTSMFVSADTARYVKPPIS